MKLSNVFYYLNFYLDSWFILIPKTNFKKQIHSLIEKLPACMIRNLKNNFLNNFIFLRFLVLVPFIRIECLNCGSILIPKTNFKKQIHSLIEK